MGKPDKPKAPNYNITWCFNGKKEWPQCAYCIRNKHRFWWPKYGTFRITFLSQAQQRAAADGACVVYKEDHALRKEMELKAKRREVAAWTRCRGCKWANWGEGSRKAILSCHNDRSEYCDQVCPMDGCEKYRKYLSKAEYERTNRAQRAAKRDWEAMQKKIDECVKRIPTADELWEAYEAQKSCDNDYDF